MYNLIELIERGLVSFWFSHCLCCGIELIHGELDSFDPECPNCGTFLYELVEGD